MKKFNLFWKFIVLSEKIQNEKDTFDDVERMNFTLRR